VSGAVSEHPVAGREKRKFQQSAGNGRQRAGEKEKAEQVSRKKERNEKAGAPRRATGRQ